jgi:opacity protein-like surface antigen
MRKLLLSTTLLIACFAASAAAQSVDKFNRVESFNGYSYFLLERPRPVGEGSVPDSFHGVNSAVTLNFKRHFGLKLDVARYSRRERLCLTGSGQQNIWSPASECFSPPLAEDDSQLRTSIINLMGGIQLKNNSNDAKLFKPFAHLLIGSTLTREETRLEIHDPGSGQVAMDFKSVTGSGFAGAVGGGFDIRMTERMDFRAIQVDYQKASIFARSSDNIRVGVGLVFR